MSGFVESSTRSPDAVVSPELALVDSALAEWSRGRPVVPAPRARARPHLTWSADGSEGRMTARVLESLVRRAHQRVRSIRSRRHPYAIVAATTLAVVAVAAAAVTNLGGGDHGLDRLVESHRSVDVGAASGSPSTASPASPATGAPSGAARRFAWAPVKGAEGYHVELYRGSERVFAGESRGPTISVPARWTYGGKRQALAPGEYRWYVWTTVSGRKGTNAIVQANLVVSST